MANEKGPVVDRLNKITIADLREFSDIFASEFNCSDIHDRVLCFEYIKGEGLIAKHDSESDSWRKICVNADVLGHETDLQHSQTCEDTQHTQASINGNVAMSLLECNFAKNISFKL
jgi:hypothetical protein